MRKLLVSVLAVAVLLGVARVCPAQSSASDTKPVVVVSFSGYQALLTDLDAIGSLAGNPDMAKGVEAMLTMMTQGKGLAGLDTKRPWGAVLESSGAGFGIYGFVPTSDAKALLGALESVGVQQKGVVDGAIEVEARNMPRPVFVKQKGDCAFICASPEALTNVPSDPIKALGDLPERYDLAIRASIKNIPEPFRQMIAAQMQMAGQMGSQQFGQQEAQRTAAQVEQAVRMLNELDTVTVGWAIDQKASSARLEIEVTALPGTDTAKEFAKGTPQKTDLAGFAMPGAAVTLNMAGELSDDSLARRKQALEMFRERAIEQLDRQGLDKDLAERVKPLLSDLLDVCVETAESRKSDLAASLLLNSDGTLSLVLGGYVADGPRLEKILRDGVAAAAKKDPGAAELVKLDAGTYQGIRLHRFSLPSPRGEEGEKISQLFGEKIQGVLGIADKGAYLAIGRDADELLKKAVGQSKATAGHEIPPMKIVVSATALAQLIGRLADDPQAQMTAAAMGALLQQAGGKDHITLTTDGIANGSRARVEFEPGILKALGSLGKMVAPGGPPAGP